MYTTFKRTGGYIVVLLLQVIILGLGLYRNVSSL